ncbi:M4 family metallopeptidase [Paenibacillus sp. R14(2021)]|uniref:M4 family metallopeptidase n=1 Tax=Paenibacillus sp. R14(2021) TaxID=2859228 RepID=UPI001C616A36|nr:M4 family metallopeptidase [Paenibacillus sp. R14(2021)]
MRYLRLKSYLASAMAMVMVVSGVFVPAASANANGNEGMAGNPILAGESQGLSLSDAPRLLQGKLSGELESDSDVVDFFTPKQDAKSLTGIKSNLSIVKKTGDNGGKQHYLLQQTYQGLPVYGKYVTAHLGADKRMYAITNDSSSDLDALSLETQPAIAPSAAAGLFQADVEQAVGYTITLGGHIAARELGQPKTELLVYPYEGTYKLAYRVEMEYIQPTIGRWTGFVDAQTGAVLKKFSLMEQAGESAAGSGKGYYGTSRAINVSQESDGTYMLIDKTKPMYSSENGSEKGTIDTYDIENPFFPITSSSSDFADPEAVDAHYFAGQVYDFYANRFGRNSLDGNGMSIISVVNGGAIDNAYWDGYEIVYGDGADLFECLTCANDVIAHEFTHAVTQYSANLDYVGQSGALNESVSDIMAAVFDDEDWAIGEDTGVAGVHGVLRDMQNPDRGLDPQPSTMAGYVQLPEDEDHDNGGVHLNSGIPNHAAYLVATGIDGVAGLEGQGRSLLGQITYGALTSYLTPTSGFEAARDAFVLAAGDLNLPEEQKEAVIAAVKDAWAAVGLPYTSNENNIVAFHTTGMADNAIINSASHTVTFQVKYGTDLTKLAPSIAVSPGASVSPDPTETQNFEVPVKYTITSDNGLAQDWLVQGAVLDPESQNNIDDFNAEFMSGPAIVDPIGHRVTVYAENDDDLTAISPVVRVSQGASVTPASGTAINLSIPVTYTVTAENGSKQTWTVAAVKDSLSPKLLAAGSISDNVVMAVFDHAMDFSTLGNTANYKLESLLLGNADPQISKVEVDCDDQNVVYLTTNALVSQNGYKLSVSNLKSTDLKGVRSDWTSTYFLSDDTAKPVLSTARVSGDKLTLTFNEYVQASYSSTRETFSLEINGSTVQPIDVTSNARRLVLTLPDRVAPTDEVSVSYKPSDEETYLNVTDFNGNELDAFKNVPVINRTNSLPIAAGKDWAHINSDVKQMIKHPTEPIVYTIADKSFTVNAVNLDTGDVESIEMDRQPERLYWANGKLYVALVDRPHDYTWWNEDQTGSIAILNGETLTKLDQFNVPIDPFDLVVDADGNIYVSSGSGQWTNFTSFSGTTKAAVDTVTIREASYLQLGSSSHLYSINTDVSPRDIYAYNVNAAAQFTDPKSTIGGYDSPYHGDYAMSTYLRISPDGNYLFNGAGTIFTTSSVKADDMVYSRSIEPFQSIVFSQDLQKFYTLDNGKLRTYNYASFQLESERAVPANAEEIFLGDEANKLFMEYANDDMGVTIAAFSLNEQPARKASPHAISAQAAAANSTSLRACPIPTSGGGGGTPPPVGGGGGGGGGGGMITPPAAPAADPTVTLGSDDFVIKQEIDTSGEKVDQVTPNPDRLAQAFKDAQQNSDTYQKEHGESITPKVVIPVGTIGNKTTVELPASLLASTSKANGQTAVVIQSNDVTYSLPLEAFSGDNLKQSLGASGLDLGNVHILITMERIGAALNSTIEQQLLEEGFAKLSASFNFTVTLDNQGKSIEMKDFNGTYVTRTFSLSDSVDANHVTALVYDPVSKGSTFVPAFVRKEGTAVFVDVKAPHNSIYTITSASKSFSDIKNHAAKNDIEIMASKKVVLGITDTLFKPEQRVTRAEFAALLVRSLGMTIPQSSTLRFIDVDQKAWYAGVVDGAAKAGFIIGDDKGRFTPNGIITRQEMAVMIARAVDYTGKAGKTLQSRSIDFNAVSDSAAVASWAADDVKTMLSSGIMETGLRGQFEPALPVTRANAVVALHKMLQQLAFIN